MKMLSFSIAMFSLLAFTACSNEPVEPMDHHNATATIKIARPAEGAKLHHGDTMHITGTISAHESLHGYNISIRDENEKKEIFFAPKHDHGTAITIDTMW